MIAFVEGMRSNVVAIDEASDAVWQAKARDLDATGRSAG